MERPFPIPGNLRSVLRVLGALMFGLVAWCTELEAAQFTLTWADNSTNETGFRIERSSNGTTFTEIATVGANVVSFVDTGLPNSTTYWYRVRAFNSAGNSGYSNVATGMTAPVASNTAPVVSAIANRSINSGSNTGAIPFTISDAESAASSLTVTRTTSNTTLVPLASVVLGGSGSNRTVTVTPVSGRTGTATITVIVSDGVASTTRSFTLTVNSATSGLSISTQPQATTITPGGAMTLSVTAQASGSVSYQWFFDGTAITGATSATYTIPLAQRANAGTYHVRVTSGSVSVTSNSVAVTAGTPGASTGSLTNLSARGKVGTNGNVLVPGFVVTGTGTKRVLLRAVGPTLASFGVSGTLPDPRLVLRRGSLTIAANNDWTDGGLGSTLQAAFSLVGAFPLANGSGDSVLLVDLEPGVYTVTASDEVASRSGIAMVEFYDADLLPGGARMTNLSNRGYLGVGDETMTTGFVVVDGSVNVLIRTVGPGLVPFGVTGTVANPQMTLFRSEDGAMVAIAANDDWGSGGDAAYTAQVTQQAGGFALPAGSRDAALVVTLPEGVYTVGSGGAGGSTGLALVELYALP